MITTAHLIVGAAVGVAMGNPYASFVAGVASHFVLDSIPHYDVSPDALRNNADSIIFTPKLWAQVWIDGIFGLALFSYWWGLHDGYSLVSPIAWGAFGGFLPDLIDNVPFWNKNFRSTRFGRSFHRWHEFTHTIWQSRFPMRRFGTLGILTQMVAIGISIWYLI